MNKAACILVLVLVILAETLSAQAPRHRRYYRFIASIDKEVVEVGEEFTLTYTLDTIGSDFQQNDFTDWKLRTGNEGLELINKGEVLSESMSFKYTLSSKNPIIFTFRGAVIIVNGQRLISNMLEVQVKAKPGASTKYQYIKPVHKVSAGQPEAEDQIWIEAIADKTKIYKGEQISVVYTLYYRPEFLGRNIDRVPAYTGFLMHNVSDFPYRRVTYRKMGRYSFKEDKVREILLAPLKSGTIDIDPFSLYCTLRLKNGIDAKVTQKSMLQGYEDVLYDLQTRKLTIEVLPLPTENRPKDFDGPIGDFNVITELSTNKTKADENVTLTVRIEGTGNFDFLRPINLTFPESVETYEATPDDSLVHESAGTVGFIVYQYMLIPRDTGHFELGAFDFHYFNPDDASYHTIHSPKLELYVSKGDNATKFNFSNIQGRDIEMIGSDIRFIKLLPFLSAGGSGPFYLSAGFFGLAILPMLLFSILYTVHKRRGIARLNIGSLNKKTALKTTITGLKELYPYVENGEVEKFYNELSHTLFRYVSNKLEVPIRELSNDKIQELLTVKGENDQAIEKLVSTLHDCELVKYSPTAATTDLEDVYQNVLLTINEVDLRIDN